MCAGGFSCRGKRQKRNEKIEKGGFLCRAGFEVAVVELEKCLIKHKLWVASGIVN